MAAIGVRLGHFAAAFAGLIGLVGTLSAATTIDGSVSQRTQKRELPLQRKGQHANRHPSPVFALDVGPAGPPLIAKDGTWWITGRDGQLVHMAWNDTLHWAIGLGASVADGAAIGEGGLLFVPTMKNSIAAIEPRGVSRWRSRAPWGIDGPLAWVPTQGLVYVSDDQHMQWLAINARLLQRSKLPGRRTAGPVTLGNSVALGTESGALLVWSSLSKRSQLQLEPPVRAIVGESPQQFLAISGTKAYFIVGASVHWQHSGVIAGGVSAAQEPGGPSLVVIARKDGKIQWLDVQGEIRAECKAAWSELEELVPEIAVTSRGAWISSSTGALWQCCTDGSLDEVPLTNAPLLRPVLDWPRKRLLVSSAEHAVWSIPLPARAADSTASTATRCH